MKQETLNAIEDLIKIGRQHKPEDQRAWRITNHVSELASALYSGQWDKNAIRYKITALELAALAIRIAEGEIRRETIHYSQEELIFVEGEK